MLFLNILFFFSVYCYYYYNSNQVPEGQLRRNRVEASVPGGGAAGTIPTARTARLLTPLPRSRRLRRIAIVRNASVSNSIARPEGRNRERAERENNGTTGGDPPPNRRNRRATANNRRTAAASLPQEKEDAKVRVFSIKFFPRSY